MAESRVKLYSILETYEGTIEVAVLEARETAKMYIFDERSAHTRHVLRLSKDDSVSRGRRARKHVIARDFAEARRLFIVLWQRELADVERKRLKCKDMLDRAKHLSVEDIARSGPVGEIVYIDRDAQGYLYEVGVWDGPGRVVSYDFDWCERDRGYYYQDSYSGPLPSSVKVGQGVTSTKMFADYVRILKAEHAETYWCPTCNDTFPERDGCEHMTENEHG